MRIRGSEIIKGRFPLHNGEIALDEWSFEALGLSPAIGQKIEMNVDYQGKKSKETFVVVGIMKDRVKEKANSIIEGLLPLTQARNDKSGFDYYVEFKSNVSIDNEINRIAKNVGIKNDDVQKNNALLEAINESGKTDWKTIDLWIIVFILAFLVISSIYELSIYNRIQDYGMLRIIGATRRQVRSVICFEMFMLLLMGIPVGILLGVIMTCSLSGMAGNILVEGSTKISHIVFSTGPIISGIMIALLAVVISAIK